MWAVRLRRRRDAVTQPAPSPERFCYEQLEVDPGVGRVTMHYSLGDRRFVESVTLGPEGDWSAPAVAAAARLLFLLAGVSYYKTAAPPVVDLGGLATTPAEREFLRVFFVEGLAEFAHRNGLSLSHLQVQGPDARPAAPAHFEGDPARPLIPFGGGIDSIVTVEELRSQFPQAALFVVSGAEDHFEAIERPAAVSGRPVLRAARALDPQVLRSEELGFLNGHVPVTGIISAIAVLAAAVHGRGAVVMSNEWSASSGTLVPDDAPGGDRAEVNHQWSKGFAFETLFRSLLADTIGPGLQYYSLLRPRSELWVARRFAALTEYHRAFRSCNRAFQTDPAQRLDRWCGQCDKCCFIDLILSPFMDPYDLFMIFGGREPLEVHALQPRFATLAGLGPDAKPFECVGNEEECRAAVLLAAARPDRARTRTLQTLGAELRAAGAADVDADRLLRPIGEHHVPHDVAAEHQLV